MSGAPRPLSVLLSEDRNTPPVFEKSAPTLRATVERVTNAVAVTPFNETPAPPFSVTAASDTASETAAVPDPSANRPSPPFLATVVRTSVKLAVPPPPNGDAT